MILNEICRFILDICDRKHVIFMNDICKTKQQMLQIILDTEHNFKFEICCVTKALGFEKKGSLTVSHKMAQEK